MTQPKKIERVERGLGIEWPDGHRSIYPAQYLRERCPCAVCKSSPSQASAEAPASVPVSPDLDILNAQAMGWYALQLTFSDRHDSGIFSYEWLRQRCPCAACAPA